MKIPVFIGLVGWVISSLHSLAAPFPLTVTARTSTQQTAVDGTYDRTIHYVDTMHVTLAGSPLKGLRELGVYFIAKENRTKRFAHHSASKCEVGPPDEAINLIARSDPLPYSRSKARDKTASPRDVSFAGWVATARFANGYVMTHASSPEVLQWFLDHLPPGLKK